MEEGEAAERFAKATRLGGYLIEGGSIAGFSIGTYLLFTRSLFSNLLRIGQTEATAYFIGVFMPSFIALTILGYLFIMPLGPKATESRNVASFCVMSYFVIVLSAFSILYFLSLFGGFLVLIASVRAYTKPAFKTLSKRETFFLVETGAMLVASFSTLFLLMQLASGFFQTYSASIFGAYAVQTLLMVVVFSFLMFFGVPFMGSRGARAGVSGTLGLALTVITFLFVVQNQYAFSSISAFLGMSILALGFSLLVLGNLGYLWLYLSEMVATDVFSVSPLDRGKYCPYCGSARVSAVMNLCSSCGRRLTWTPYAPFCSSCGLLVPKDAKACPHCKENISSKRIYFNGQFEKDNAILDRALEKLEREKTWTARIQLSILQGLKRVTTLAHRFGQSLVWINDRLALTLKDAVFICVLSLAFNFLAFVIPINWNIVDIGYGWQTYGRFYGYPFEWLLVKMGGFPPISINWGALILDIILYLLLATAVVTAVARLWRRSS